MSGFREAVVALRPETPDDRTFLRELYLSVREGEPGFRDLDPAERNRLLGEQFELQDRHYRRVFAHAWFTVVTVDGREAGRLCVARQPGELRVVDLALLPGCQGHGIGTQLLRNVQAEAVRTRTPIRLSVVHDGPARGFYQRLGFRQRPGVGDAIRSEWEWIPPSPPV